MRVGLVLDPWEFPFNGTVISARRFVRALANRGFEFSVLCAEGERERGRSPTKEEGVDTIRFPKLSMPGYNGVMREMRVPWAKPVRSALDSALRPVDLLHVQVASPLGMAATRQARALRLPVLWTFNVQPENMLWNMGFKSSWLSHLVSRVGLPRIYNRADLVIAPSPFAAELLLRHGVTVPIRVISNGVPDAFFVSPARSTDRFRVLSVGRFAREKRLGTLLRAVARSAKRHIIEVRLTGVGPDRGRLERLARRLGVNAAFEWVDDATLIERYRAADLVVHTSAIELEGMAVLESMAASNTVLIADSGRSACSRLANRPEASFRTDDSVDLAKKIDFWIDRDDERLSQGRENQRRARRFAHARSVDALADLYAEMGPERTHGRGGQC